MNGHLKWMLKCYRRQRDVALAKRGLETSGSISNKIYIQECTMLFIMGNLNHYC